YAPPECVAYPQRLPRMRSEPSGLGVGAPFGAQCVADLAEGSLGPRGGQHGLKEVAAAEVAAAEVAAATRHLDHGRQCPVDCGLVPLCPPPAEFASLLGFDL